MKNKYTLFYQFTVLISIALSAYPIYMGIKILSAFLKDGYVLSDEYPKYVIPYAPMCVALIVITALFPLIYRALKRGAAFGASILGTGIFLILENLIEGIKVLEGYTEEVVMLPIEAWQYSLCIATPEVLQSIGEPIYAEANNAFKIHFYLIAIVIIIVFSALLYGYTKLFKGEGTTGRTRLYVTTLCFSLFIGLCVLACFTAFFRNGTIYISPLSSFLTGLFFVVFGVTFGVCLSKRPLLASLIAFLTTAAMYAGELLLMGGELFRFGMGRFFRPIPIKGIPFSMCDILIMLFSAFLAFLLVKASEK